VHRDGFAFFSQRRVLRQPWTVVQFVDSLGDQHAIGVVKGPLADTLARVEQRRPVAGSVAQIRVERPRAADRRGKLLAVIIGTSQPAQVAAVADSQGS
jgi:hypothetical protein